MNPRIPFPHGFHEHSMHAPERIVHRTSESFNRSDSSVDLPMTKTLRPRAPPPPSMNEATNPMSSRVLSQSTTQFLPFLRPAGFTPGVSDFVGQAPPPFRIGARPYEVPRSAQPFSFDFPRFLPGMERHKPSENKGETPATVSKPKPNSKKRISVPDVQKEDVSLEQKRKKVEDEKRSGEVEQQRRDAMEYRVVFLERQNLDQQAEVERLKEENEKQQAEMVKLRAENHQLRFMLFKENKKQQGKD